MRITCIGFLVCLVCIFCVASYPNTALYVIANIGFYLGVLVSAYGITKIREPGDKNDR